MRLVPPDHGGIHQRRPIAKRGRRSSCGSVSGFDYSPALKASHLTWTPDNLDKFLEAPATLVPGTRMALTVAKPAARADLIAYLKTLSAPQ